MHRIRGLKLFMTRLEATATKPEADGEEFEFQAEVGRVMDIIINSLYSNKAGRLRLPRYRTLKIG